MTADPTDTSYGLQPESVLRIEEQADPDYGY